MSEAAVVALAEEPPVPAASPTPAAPPEPAAWSEESLRARLAEAAVIVGLDKQQAAELIKTLRAEAKPESLSRLVFLPTEEDDESKPPESAVTPALLAQIGADGLPFRMGEDCRLDAEAAEALELRSQILQPSISRINLIRHTNRSMSQSQWIHIERGLISSIEQGNEWKTAAAVPAMTQILQTESQPVRQQLVRTLASIDDKVATRALVARALFDLSQEVRHSANQALAERAVERYQAERTQAEQSKSVADEVRGPLLEGLRYPWPPVAWHAAETLVAVNDRDAVADLIDLLDAPDPARPHRDETGRLVVRELVRVNHLRNCLLCHAPSTRTTDRVAAVVPTPGRPLQPVYYGSPRRPSDVFVRADVTYLRQDFSVMHELPDEKPWPTSQRFDYMVRTRPVDAEDVPAVAERPSAAEPGYPQRDAVLYALRKLTGQDGGTTSAGWRRLRTARLSPDPGR